MTYEYKPDDKFGYKDTLPEGHDEKIIKGSEFDDEFRKISNAFKVLDPDFDGDIEIGGIDGLQDALDGKADQSALEKEIQDRINGDQALQDQIDALDPDGDRKVDWTEIEGKPDEFPPEPHTHDQYLTDETDPVFSASPAASITEEMMADWSDHTDPYDDTQIKADLATETKARIDGDAALAQDITDLEAAVGGVAGQLAFAGSYDADAGVIVKSNLSEFVEGQPLPDYSTVEGKFVIVAVAGDTPEELGEGDWLVSGESGWVAVKYGTAGSVAWENVVGAPDFLTDAQGSIDGDSKQYVRKNGAWAEATGDSPWERNGDDIYYNDGNVGIGTDTPAETLTVSGPILSTKAIYGINQDEAYMIAAGQNYNGSTTDWGAYGYQHKLKTNSTGGSRITIDTINGEVWSMTSSGSMIAAKSGHFKEPDDYFGTTGWYGIGDIGALAAQSGTTIMLTAGGYRGPDNEFRTLGSATGVSQIQLNNNIGNIVFRTQNDRAEGSSYTVPSRMQINATGEVGIGMIPVSVTAKENLDGWQSELEAILEDNPDIDMKAAVREATGGEFDVMPTEEQVAAWMETRAAGDLLQVEGNIYAKGSANFDGSLRFGNQGITAFDINTEANKPGFYSIGDVTNGSNWPMDSGSFCLSVTPGNNLNNHTQLAYNVNQNRAFFRTKRNSNYNDWKEFVTADADGDVSINGNVGIGTDSPAETLTVAGPILSNKASYGSNQNEAYMIAAGKGYNGLTTNWATHGFQHRLKSNSTGGARTTIDTVQGEVWSMGGDGHTTFAGNVGIGMTPLGRDAKEQLAEWSGWIEAKLELEPSLDRKAATLDVTDGAFEVLPTEEALAKWLEERAAGDALQVSGNMSASGTVSANTIETSRPTNGFFFTAKQGNDSTTFSHTGNDTLEINPLGSKMLVNGNISASGTVNADGIVVAKASGTNVAALTSKTNSGYALIRGASGFNSGILLGDGGIDRVGLVHEFSDDSFKIQWFKNAGGSNVNRARLTLTSGGNLTVDGNATFNGNVYATNVFRNGSVLTSAKDLIETLHTLRNATKDETTLEGLRDAIGNAVGQLIEKFETMQSAATQEIDL